MKKILRPMAVREGRRILIAFSRNYGYSSLLLHPNMTSGSFLKVSGHVESELFTGLSCILNFETSSIGHWKILVY